VSRRFQSLGVAVGIEVVDDFAHNPAKLTAAIVYRAGPSRRVLAVYQPHGFGPTRFLRPDLVEAFAEALGREDRLWMLEVFYAGAPLEGTSRRRDRGRALRPGRHARFAERRTASRRDRGRGSGG
jgi:UDP-N-acetylmuramate--alanine ligase